MTNQKPSERIKEIREKLNKEGHTVGSAYYLEAILQYLDEQWEKNNTARFTTFSVDCDRKAQLISHSPHLTNPL